MKKTATFIIVALICLFAVGCAEKDHFKADLEKIPIPDMSNAILDSDESSQLAWLESIYDFELDTLRSKSSDLSDKNLETVEEHLSQVYGVELAQLLIDGFYAFDQDKQTHYVPDGDWFSYNNQWHSSEFTLTDRTEQSATFVLNGHDENENPRNIQFEFSIRNEKLLLENRIYLN